jgi:cytochrome P450
MSKTPWSGTLPTSSIPGPPRLSLLRSILTQMEMDRDPIRFMQCARRRYGDLVRFQNRFGSVLFAFGPEHNHRLYTETDLFHSRPFVLPGPRNSAQYRLRQSIFSLNQHAHRRMRHQLLPPFQRSALAGYHSEVAHLVRAATSAWWPGQQRNLHRDIHLLVWSVIRKLLFGLDESAASESLHEAMEHWMFQTFAPWVRSVPLPLPFSPYRRMVREAERLEQQFLSLMRARRQEGARGADALSALLRFRHEDGTPVPDTELVGHALTLFLVAYETTGNTLTWTLFLLAQHPQVQHDLLDELAPWRGEAPPGQVLDRLPVLNRVLKESMRLLPAVPYSRRLVSRDCTIGPYLVPRKTRIIFSNYITHHMPEIYAYPERFAPDRWETINPTPAEYLPFGAGARTCLGAALAQFVMKIAITLIVPAWRLQVLPHAQIDRCLGISLGPRNGLPVVVARQDRRLQASPIRGNIHEMVELREIDERGQRRAA